MVAAQDRQDRLEHLRLAVLEEMEGHASALTMQAAAVVVRYWATPHKRLVALAVEEKEDSMPLRVRMVPRTQVVVVVAVALTPHGRVALAVRAAQASS